MDSDPGTFSRVGYALWGAVGYLTSVVRRYLRPTSPNAENDSVKISPEATGDSDEENIEEMREGETESAHMLKREDVQIRGHKSGVGWDERDTIIGSGTEGESEQFMPVDVQGRVEEAVRQDDKELEDGEVCQRTKTTIVADVSEDVDMERLTEGVIKNEIAHLETNDGERRKGGEGVIWGEISTHVTQRKDERNALEVTEEADNKITCPQFPKGLKDYAVWEMSDQKTESGVNDKSESVTGQASVDVIGKDGEQEKETYNKSEWTEGETVLRGDEVKALGQHSEQTIQAARQPHAETDVGLLTWMGREEQHQDNERSRAQLVEDESKKTGELGGLEKGGKTKQPEEVREELKGIDKIEGFETLERRGESKLIERDSEVGERERSSYHLGGDDENIYKGVTCVLPEDRRRDVIKTEEDFPIRLHRGEQKLQTEDGKEEKNKGETKNICHDHYEQKESRGEYNITNRVSKRHSEKECITEDSPYDGPETELNKDGIIQGNFREFDVQEGVSHMDIEEEQDTEQPEGELNLKDQESEMNKMEVYTTKCNLDEGKQLGRELDIEDQVSKAPNRKEQKKETNASLHEQQPEGDIDVEDTVSHMHKDEEQTRKRDVGSHKGEQSEGHNDIEVSQKAEKQKTEGNYSWYEGEQPEDDADMEDTVLDMHKEDEHKTKLDDSSYEEQPEVDIKVQDLVSCMYRKKEQKTEHKDSFEEQQERDMKIKETVLDMDKEEEQLTERSDGFHKEQPEEDIEIQGAVLHMQKEEEQKTEEYYGSYEGEEIEEDDDIEGTVSGMHREELQKTKRDVGSDGEQTEGDIEVEETVLGMHREEEQKTEQDFYEEQQSEGDDRLDMHKEEEQKTENYVCSLEEEQPKRYTEIKETELDMAKVAESLTERSDGSHTEKPEWDFEVEAPVLVMDKEEEQKRDGDDHTYEGEQSDKDIKVEEAVLHLHKHEEPTAEHDDGSCEKEQLEGDIEVEDPVLHIHKDKEHKTNYGSCEEKQPERDTEVEETVLDMDKEEEQRAEYVFHEEEQPEGDTEVKETVLDMDKEEEQLKDRSDGFHKERPEGDAVSHTQEEEPQKTEEYYGSYEGEEIEEDDDIEGTVSGMHREKKQKTKRDVVSDGEQPEGDIEVEETVLDTDKEEGKKTEDGLEEEQPEENTETDDAVSHMQEEEETSEGNYGSYEEQQPSRDIEVNETVPDMHTEEERLAEHGFYEEQQTERDAEIRDTLSDIHKEEEQTPEKYVRSLEEQPDIDIKVKDTVVFDMDKEEEPLTDTSDVFYKEQPEQDMEVEDPVLHMHKNKEHKTGDFCSYEEEQPDKDIGVRDTVFDTDKEEEQKTEYSFHKEQPKGDTEIEDAVLHMQLEEPQKAEGKYCSYEGEQIEGDDDIEDSVSDMHEEEEQKAKRDFCPDEEQHQGDIEVEETVLGMHREEEQKTDDSCYEEKLPERDTEVEDLVSYISIKEEERTEHDESSDENEPPETNMEVKEAVLDTENEQKTEGGFYEEDQPKGDIQIEHAVSHVQKEQQPKAKGDYGSYAEEQSKGNVQIEGATSNMHKEEEQKIEKYVEKELLGGDMELKVTVLETYEVQEQQTEEEEPKGDTEEVDAASHIHRVEGQNTEGNYGSYEGAQHERHIDTEDSMLRIHKEEQQTDRDEYFNEDEQRAHLEGELNTEKLVSKIQNKEKQKTDGGSRAEKQPDGDFDKEDGVPAIHKGMENTSDLLEGHKIEGREEKETGECTESHRVMNVEKMCEMFEPASETLSGEVNITREAETKDKRYTQIAASDVDIQGVMHGERDVIEVSPKYESHECNILGGYTEVLGQQVHEKETNKLTMERKSEDEGDVNDETADTEGVKEGDSVQDLGVRTVDAKFEETDDCKDGALSAEVNVTVEVLADEESEAEKNKESEEKIRGGESAEIQMEGKDAEYLESLHKVKGAQYGHDDLEMLVTETSVTSKNNELKPAILGEPDREVVDEGREPARDTSHDAEDEVDEGGEQETRFEIEKDFAIQLGVHSLDFTAQKSRIFLKNRQARPPKNPRTLLQKPSMTLSPTAPALVKEPVGIRVGGVGVMGIKLPGIGGAVPVTERGVREATQEDTRQEPTHKESTADKEQGGTKKWATGAKPGGMGAIGVKLPGFGTGMPALRKTDRGLKLREESTEGVSQGAGDRKEMGTKEKEEKSRAPSGVRLPDLGSGFPVLRKTEMGARMRTGEVHEKSGGEQNSEDVYKRVHSSPSSEHSQAQNSGTDSPPWMSDLKNKLRKTERK